LLLKRETFFSRFRSNAAKLKKDETAVSKRLFIFY
jgi:hypothetical protein